MRGGLAAPTSVRWVCTGRTILADIRPFRGIRFDVDQVGGLNAVIGPPEDIPSDERARVFTRNRPYNSVQLEMRDPSRPSQFTEAGCRFRQWLADGILRRDDRPGFYVYEHTFTWQGERRRQRGFFGALRLTPPEEGVVLPHENVLPENLGIRVALLRGIEANLSAVYTLIEDEGRIAAALDRVVQAEPDVAGKDDDGSLHRLWVVHDQDIIDTLQAGAAGRELFIADGHHRYAAALAYQKEQGAGANGERPVDRVLTFVVPTSDPGVMILPIHRLVRDLTPAAWTEARARLERVFDIEERRVAPVDVAATVRTAFDELAGCSALPAFVVLEPGGERLLTICLRDWESIEPLLPNGSSELTRRLDVTVLDAVVLRAGLGIDDSTLERRVEFSPDAAGLCFQVQAGTTGAAFFLRPTPLESLLAVARAGDRMPQKSTYFYPKIPIGLVMRDLR